MARKKKGSVCESRHLVEPVPSLVASGNLALRLTGDSGSKNAWFAAPRESDSGSAMVSG
jgi:hypothetical protein